ncbi:18170_t:CDS:2 [Funneliformis geosporum]|uniref:6764_t:CDS:1 n=1 Tax=Funneliformis geosporum TaxID=1117311 RepID=A0A9W4WZY3_9GLOM|nr:6764_t:CDS:2 [Funneliformis geosporum]CAI2176382.1 18170_t:CDS:2 [Funneliformis geosporum]
MGSCISSSSQKQTNQNVGVSSATYSQTTNKTVNNRFHENTNVVSSPKDNARKAKVVKRPKKIHKGLIGLPSNFQHTGHIGIAELRSGKVDPEKIKSQMAEVAAALSLEGLNMGSSIPTPATNNNKQRISLLTSISTPSEQQNVTNNNSKNVNSSNSPTFSQNDPQNDPQFKVKRKPTLTSISSPVPRPSSPPLSPIVDPMAEIVAALKMPIDGNFDKQNDQKLVV